MIIQYMRHFKNKFPQVCIVGGGGLTTSTNLYGRRKTYLVRFPLSYYGAKEVLNRVPRDII